MTDQQVNVNLNGVDLKTVTQLAHDIDMGKDQASELADYSRKCRVRWLNGFNSQAFTRDTPPFGMDEPEWLGGSNAAMAASEALLGAIGGCVAVGFAANASVRSVEIHELEIEVEGTIDIPSFLGLRDGNPGYKAVTVTIYVNCDAEGDLLEEIAYRAMQLSPVVNTVKNPVEITSVLKDIS